MRTIGLVYFMFIALDCFCQGSFEPTILDSIANLSDVVKNNHIKAEVAFSYRLKHHQIADSTIYEKSFYNDDGNVLEIDELNKDGKTAWKIFQMTYLNMQLSQIRQIEETYTEGINFNYKEPGVIDYTYSYKTLTAKPTDTAYTTLKQFVYDSSTKSMKIFLQTSRQKLHLYQKWHFDENEKGVESFDENSNSITSIYLLFDSTMNKLIEYQRNENGGKEILNEKYFDKNKKRVREINFYKKSGTIFYYKLESTYQYNPNGTLFEVQKRYENQNSRIYRHYYLIK